MRPPLSRSVRRLLAGATPLGAFLVATVVLAGWFAYEALNAVSSQRRTAEAVLQDYAEISATELASVARDGIDDVLDDVFEPVARRVRDGQVAPVELVSREIDDALDDEDCECPSFRAPLMLFRVDRLSGSVDVIPPTLTPAARDRLAALAHAPGVPGDDGEERLVTMAAGDLLDQPVAVGFGTFRSSGDAPSPADATFGLVVPLEAAGELFAEWYSDQRLLPEPIAQGQPNDSLLYVTVQDPAGHTVFASSITYPADFSATSSVGAEYGDLEVRATVRPDAAGQLIIGGLPRSRLPLLVALLVLTLGVGVAAVVQLRRESEFQRLREDFVSGVSHELRTPLAQIRMFAELQRAGKLQTHADQERATAVIDREARRLSHLVENILQFSRLRRAAGQGMPREKLDLAEALADGLDAVIPPVQDRGIRLDVSAEPGVPIVANRDALTRILVNLLDTAVKYGPQGQTVRVGVERVNGSVQLSVADQGPGIPAADRGRVWKAYRRLERDVKARTPGTGIGLSVVSELAALQEGRAWVEEAVGGGARFIIEFPLADSGSARPSGGTSGDG